MVAANLKSADSSLQQTPDKSRGRLTKELIFEAALKLVDQEGVRGLTMRRLGAALGVEAMSLYNHVRNKSDLLTALVVNSVADVDHEAGGAGDWKARLKGTMVAYHQVFIAHPNLMDLGVDYFPAASMYGHHERDIKTLVESGFAPAEALRSLQVLFAFATGESKLAANARSHGVQHQSQAQTVLDNLPNLRLAYSQLAATPQTSTFEYGLDLLLEAIEARRLRADD